MQWESTDQFGNMFIGICEGAAVSDLGDPLTSLVEELHVRNPEGFQITIDFGYGEINGPDPENVSHVIQAQFITEGDSDAMFAQLSSLIETECQAKGAVGVKVARA